MALNLEATLVVSLSLAVLVRVASLGAPATLAVKYTAINTRDVVPVQINPRHVYRSLLVQGQSGELTAIEASPQMMIEPERSV